MANDSDSTVLATPPAFVGDTFAEALPVQPKRPVPMPWTQKAGTACPYGLPFPKTEPQGGTYAEAQKRRATVAIPRHKLIEELSKNFYVNEQGVFITRLNTDVLCFKSDLKNPAVLEQKIERAISYAAEFQDVEALDALRYISRFPPGREQENTTAPQSAKSHVTLGLYLYLADECSRLGKTKTFLSAMRDAGAERDLDNPQSSAELYARTMEALRILGMDESHGNILREWNKQGTFTVQHETNGLGPNGQVTGAYATLARNIAQRQLLLGINLPISYALGNRPYAAGKTPEQLYNMTRDLARPESAAKVEERLTTGHELRKSRLRELIVETMSAYPDSQTPPEKAREIAGNVLNMLPDITLEIMHRNHYSLAYATEENLSKSYPQGHINGVADSNANMARISVGSVNPRHRTIFTCNGRALNGEIDEKLLQQSVAHTLLHESMHMLVGELGKHQKQVLKKAVAAAHDELVACPILPDYMLKFVKSMDKRSIAQKLNYNHPMYDGYVKLDREGVIVRNNDGTPVWDQRWEEVICNTYSMMNSKAEPMASHSPLHEPELPAVRHLAEAINEATKLGIAAARKEDWKVSQQSAARKAAI